MNFSFPSSFWPTDYWQEDYWHTIFVPESVSLGRSSVTDSVLIKSLSSDESVPVDELSDSLHTADSSDERF